MALTFEEQKELLEASISSGVSLSKLLAQHRQSYDDLVYAVNLDAGQDEAEAEGPVIDDIEPLEPAIPAVSFFSGAGGLDIGFELAGFNNLISIEFNEIFCNTLRHNNPGKLIIGPPAYSGDISHREEIAALLRANGIHENFEGVFHGGPPCQSFSVAAAQRFAKDSDRFKRRGFEDEEKGQLIFDYIWYIREFRPLAFLIENVAGIVDFDTEGEIQRALDELQELGYLITEPMVVNAAYYGVPQNRK